MSDEYEISFLTGNLEFKPPEFRITSRVERVWWCDRRRWYVETELARLGPFDTAAQARDVKRYADGQDVDGKNGA